YYNGAFYRDATTVQLFIICGDTVIYVNERAGDIAVHRVSIVDRELAGLSRSRIDRNWRLGKLRDVVRGLDQLNHALLRSRKQHAKGLDARVKTPLLQPRENPFGVVLVVWRADMVRIGRQPFHVSAEIFRARNRAIFLLP